MDRGVKIVLASCLLGAGIGGAMLFRHPLPPPRPSKPGAPDGLMLRQENDARVAPPPPADRLTARIEPSTAAPPSSGLAARSKRDSGPVGPGQAPPPPPLARSYPPFRDRAVSPGDRWMQPDGTRTENTAAPGRTHKIVDGDTLADLAERYLGDANRCLEIYEANRDLLPSPGVLPIGIEIRLPPRAKPDSGSRSRPPRPGVVPVSPSLAPRQHGSP